jgi:hypothetical protein
LRINIPQTGIPKTEDLTSRREAIVNEVQQQVQVAIDLLVESGAERGMQVGAYYYGEPVVDAVAGVADPATGRPVRWDTPFYCYSVGKSARYKSTLSSMRSSESLENLVAFNNYGSFLPVADRECTQNGSGAVRVRSPALASLFE